MVNSLGALPPMELSVISKAALEWLAKKEVTVKRVYVGTFMTSLDMNGFSLTLMRVDAATMARLDATHQAPAWPLVPGVYDPAKAAVPVPAGTDADALVSSAGPASRGGVAAAAAIAAACNALIGMEAQLTQWDTLVGDGDCGLTLTRGAKAILADIDPRYPLDDPAATAVQLGLSVRRSMGGTSGALYDIFFNAAAASLKSTPAGAGGAEAGAWATALSAGTAAIQHYGGASAGHRTMLDALLPAAAAFQQALSEGSAVDAIAKAAAAAQAGAESTKHMGTAAGRSSYVPEAALKDTPDPGAMAAACWLQAVAASLK
uniref:Dihydroxyacetone kinase n=1 Tax=Pyramimonas obovata TaxID=1411642 RepID=A0A7S0RX56_9CHLO|mmetsp:Transcript_7351/g.14991  ORF Transcript_7351/g.14991 Transcript_7351/m.14991 type:complete len:318 (+) Transcript_7351:49-1002(+)